MHTYLRPILFTVFVAACFAACTSSEIGNSRDVNPETIYTDYSVSYTEGQDSVNCYLQYRFAGDKGTTLVLSSPSRVTIDGKDITVDSGTLAGAFYEKQFFANSFTGHHLISFTDVNGKNHEEKFSFKHITCNTIVPALIKRADLVFEFTGIEKNDLIDITISDTSAETEDVHINSKPTGNFIKVSSAQFKPLKNGPVQIAISKNEQIPLQQPTAEGGSFSLNQIIMEEERELKD